MPKFTKRGDDLLPTGWLGGLVVRTSDSWLAVEGSPPGHDTAWLFISEIGDRLWRVNCLGNCNHPPPRSTQPCIPSESLNRVPASAGVKAGKSPLPSGRQHCVIPYGMSSRSGEVISTNCYTRLPTQIYHPAKFSSPCVNPRRRYHLHNNLADTDRQTEIVNDISPACLSACGDNNNRRFRIDNVQWH